MVARKMLLIPLVLTATFGILVNTAAQAYPTRPVRWIVGFPPGGATDIVARLLGQWLSERLGQPFVIENRPGAGTNIATDMVANAPPDGHTLLFVSPANAIAASFYENLKFNFIRDIVPVAGIVRVPLVVEVNQSFAAVTLSELIAYAKANPGKINMASGGSGTTQHLSGELFKMMTGVNMVHVPYRGEALAMTDLLAGQVHVLFGTLPGSIEQITAGKVRPLAVTTATRSDVLPDVPSIADFVPGYEASAWFGVGAPKNTFAAVVNTLNGEINAALADPRMRARLAEVGGMLLPGTSGDFERLIADETGKWAKVVKFSGARAH